jgi:hypothetical protein
MRKVEILLDEEKIKAERTLSLKMIYADLDKSFVDYAGMHKQIKDDGTIMYSAFTIKDQAHNARIGHSIVEYAERKWFMANAIKFIHGSTDGIYDPYNYCEEDILKEWSPSFCTTVRLLNEQFYNARKGYDSIRRDIAKLQYKKIKLIREIAALEAVRGKYVEKINEEKT